MQPGQVGVTSRFIAFTVIRVELHERLGDVAHVDLGVGQALPRMRIRYLFAVLLQHQRNDARTGVDAFASRLATGQQALQPGFETQAVGDDQVGPQQCFGVIRARFINMRIGICVNQVSQFNPITTDLLGKVSENAEAGDDIELFLGMQ